MTRPIFFVVSTLLAVYLAAVSASAADTSASGSVDLVEVRALIDGEDYEKAFKILSDAIAQDPNNADTLNLMGYAARMSGNLGDAAIYYARALESDQDHVGALEYQGELYLLLERPEKAEANLERLRGICGEMCEEYLDLAKDIAVFRGGS